MKIICIFALLKSYIEELSVSKSKEKTSEFNLEGRFLGFVGKSRDKPKRLRITTAEGECAIKLAKALRGSVADTLVEGDWIEVSGKQEFKPKKGKLKRQAEHVRATNPGKREVASPVKAAPEQAKATPKKNKDSVLVCQKSSCCKRGGKAVYQAVADSLQKQGLEDQVALKSTGCMSQCKKGPCVVFKPDKSRYIGVDPKNVPELVEKHFADKLNPETSNCEPLVVR